MSTIKIGPLDHAEEKVIRFRFVDELPSGNTLQSATVEVTVNAGTDASPESLKEGDAQISGTDVLQRVRGRPVNASYHLRCIATDDNGQVHVISCDMNQRLI